MSMPPNDFAVHSKPEQAQILAQELPNGQNLTSKILVEKNLYKFLLGVGIECSQSESYIHEMVRQHDISVTENLIEEWERAVGIPDSCFSGTGTIEERRRDVIAKISSFGVSTEQQFIDLAAQYGYTITIEHRNFNSTPFDMQFDYPLGSGDNAGKFVMFVIFEGVSPPQNTFDMMFDYIFDDGPYNIVICLFNKLKPANTLIIYEFRP